MKRSYFFARFRASPELLLPAKPFQKQRQRSNILKYGFKVQQALNAHETNFYEMASNF